jgi:hypothetical protein
MARVSLAPFMSPDVVADMIYDLDPFDLNNINMFAARQRAAREATKHHSQMKSPNFSEFGLHYVGAMGEYAVAKYLGLDLDYRILSGPDDGTDLQSVIGSVQVKTFSFTGKKKIDLFFNSISDFKASVAVGVQIINPTRLRFLGWITQEQFINESDSKDYRHGGVRSFVSEDKLTGIEVLRYQIQNHAKAA